MGQNESTATAQAEVSESSGTETITVQQHESEYELRKPDRLNPAHTELNEDDRKTMFLRRSVISILNKLTPENFPMLSQQLKTLSIGTSARMQQVVELIHAKAILEWKFCALYAEICDLMQDVEVVDELGVAKSFSMYLIAQCETFFQTSLSEDFRFGGQEHEINLCLDGETERPSMSDNEENKREFRRKAIGNCQFIGELFKVYLIHPKIIFLILDQLSKAKGNMAVECKCALLTTIGLFYEEKIGKLPAVYFAELESLLPAGELSPQIRFTIQDVLDLRKNSWRPRRLPELPKTLEQIERDLIEEEKNQKLSESMSRLDYFSKNSAGDDGKVISRPHLTNWTKISAFFFYDEMFEAENNQNEIQVDLPVLSRKSFEDSVREILGELTTENFEWSAEMMKQLPINGSSELNCIAVSIHEEALNKPDQCKLYAEMCHTLRILCAPSSTTILKTVIVSRCEFRFNCDKTSKLEEYGTELYHKSVANCRFMGELFNVEVLSDIILTRCVKKLLTEKSPGKESFEYLFELLNVAGKNLILRLMQKKQRIYNKTNKLIITKGRHRNVYKLINKFQVFLEENRSNLSSEMISLLEELISMRPNNETVTEKKLEQNNSDQLVDEIVPLENDQNKEPIENIARPGTSDSSVLDDSTRNSEYFEPVANASDELSINRPKEFSSSSEKSYHSERTDYSGKSVDEEGVSSTKLKEKLVSRDGKKHTVEFLKSLRDVPESKRLLKVNVPNGMYSDCHNWEGVSSTKLKEKLVSRDGKKHTVEFLKSLRDVPESKRLLKVNIPDGMYSDCHIWEGVSSTKLKEKLVSRDGKKHTVEFLKSLRDVPESKRLLKVNIPDGMYSDCHIWPPPSKSTCLMPDFMKSIPKRKNQQNEPKNVSPSPIYFTLRLKNDFLSCSSKDPQIPTKLTPKSKDSSTDQAEIRELCKSVNDFLDELPSKNIRSVFENINKLPIDNVSKINSVIDVIYNRAVNEHDNCRCYAELCHMMQNLNVPDEKSGKLQMFRIILINKCQQVFESGIAVVLDVITKQDEVDICTDEMKKELKSLFEQNKPEFRRKVVGNCRLVGEMFKLQMLTAKIMLRCVAKFLPSADEVSLECLCTLLKVAGKEMEMKLSPAQKKEFGSCFQEIQNLLGSEKYQLSSRIRLMLQDVINLKNNQWISVPENNESFPSHSFENVQISAALAPNVKNLSADEKEIQELYKSVTEILKEFTSLTIYSLQEKVKELPIDKVHKLQGVIDLIYNTAVDEPINCKSCAELCFLMDGITVFDSDSRSMKTFRKLLINKCQQELESVFEKHESVSHRKAIENYRFVGEIFKFNMLTIEFILLWTTKLLELSNDVSLKCLCTLLKIIGEYLSPDQEKGLTLCFEKIQDLLINENLQVSPKVRSMLQDVINLINNQWIPVPTQKSSINDDSEIINEQNQEISKSEIVTSSQKLKISSDEKLKIKDEVPPKNRPTDLFRTLRSVFNQWILNENLPNWFEDTKHKLDSEILSGAVSELIQFVMKTYPQSADKCGQLFVYLIEHDYIQRRAIIEGFVYFLNTVENRELFTKLELILKPLFERGFLKLDDLNTISQSNVNIKPIENKEKSTTVSQNKSAPKEQEKNFPTSSQPKLQNIPDQQRLASSSSHFDPFFSVTSGISDSSVQSSKFDVIPMPLRQAINDLLKTITPHNFKLASFERKLENIPFQKIIELEFAAFCIIQRVEKKPELYEFCFNLCCPMMMLTAAKIRFWMILMKDCNTFFQRKIFSGETSTDEIVKNKFKGFCRFFSLLVNKLNNRFANAIVQQILKKLLYLRKIDYFCEIYDFLDYTNDRFEKSLFESCIPELLSSNELEIEFKNMLKRVSMDYAMKVSSISSKIMPSNYRHLHQVAPARVTNKGIELQKNVIKSSNVPNDVKNTSLCGKKPTVVATLNNAVVSENSLKYLDNFLKKKKKKNRKKKAKMNASSTVDLNLPVENQAGPSDCRSNLSNDQSEPSTSNSNLPKNQNSDFVLNVLPANDKTPSSISYNVCAEMLKITCDILNQLQLRPKIFLRLAQRMISMPIDREARLSNIAHIICNKAMQDCKNGKLYVVLCEHLQNWNIIDKDTGKVASFKFQMITVLHSKCYQLNLKIKGYLENAKLETEDHHVFVEKVIRYCRLLCAFLESPIFGSDLLIVPALELLLLDPIDENVMELLNEFLIIFRNDLGLKLEILDSQLSSYEAIDFSTQEFEKYDVMFKMIRFLQQVINFQKYDRKLNNRERSEKGIETSDEKNDNEIESFQDPDQVPENRRITHGKDVDSFLKMKPDYIENTIKCFEEESKYPEELLDSIIRSLCLSFDSQLKMQESERENEKFSYALFLKIFGKNVPSFESRCLTTALEYTKKSNFQSGILSNVFEFFFLYGIISYQSLVQFKNAFVSNKISEIIEMLNSSIFREYKLSKNPQA